MKKYNDEAFIAAIKSCRSIRQVLHQLGLKEAGGNYASCKDKIKKLGLDISHMKGRGWSKGHRHGPKRPVSYYLFNGSSIQSFKLKNKLLQEGLLKPTCYNCLNDTWLNGPIPLELEHIDGNSKNNELSNLTLLCPNCHALTSTYRGKNIGRSGENRTHT